MAQERVRSSRIRINKNTHGHWVVSFRNIAVCQNGYVWERKEHINCNGIRSHRFSRVKCSFDEYGYMVAIIHDKQIRIYKLVYEAYAREKAPRNLEAQYINKDHRDNRISNLTFAKRITPDLSDFPGGVKLEKANSAPRPFGGYHN